MALSFNRRIRRQRREGVSVRRLHSDDTTLGLQIEVLNVKDQRDIGTAFARRVNNYSLSAASLSAASRTNASSFAA